ncbi:MAG: hypothetical protein K8R41_09100, partial [Bacteroidales bacterium]|nr:hypothetical protein [Bacteroidales bacterium]
MSLKKPEKYFPKTISKKQASDTGMAVVLILLLIGFFTNSDIYFKIAIPFLIINMIVPMFFYLFAFVWLGFSTLLGTIVSKIILSIVYIILVVPTGLFRRIIGKDPLQLKEFKKNKDSVMKTRNYSFSSKDIEKP